MSKANALAMAWEEYAARNCRSMGKKECTVTHNAFLSGALAALTVAIEVAWEEYAARNCRSMGKEECAVTHNAFLSGALAALMVAIETSELPALAAFGKDVP